MKISPEEVLAILLPIIDDSSVLIHASQSADYFDEVSDRTLRQALQQVAGILGGTMRAILELHSVYEDMITCHRMTRRYPWRGTQIKRSQHLQFVWVQFVNQCYLFHEKYKLTINQLNRCNKVFGREPIAISPGLKEINKAMGKLIRARGQHFHEWFEHNKHIQFFTMVELINSVKKEDGPLGDVEGHYADAKNILCAEIEATTMFAEAFFRKRITLHVSDFSVMLDAFKQIVHQSKN
jgi:hypothetical protein